MDKNFWGNEAAAGVSQAQAGTMAQFFTQVYTWMALGLALTGFMAVLTVSSPTLYNFVFGSRLTFYGLLIGEVGLVIAFSAALRRGASLPVVAGMFIAYAALNGLTMAALFLVYTYHSIAQVFFITAGTFGGMSLYGFATKKDLTGLGQFAMMGVWGLLLAVVVNIFLQSDMLSYVYSIIGVGIFTALTAWDTQKLKAQYLMHAGREDDIKRLTLRGALELYLDFINLFIFLLRLLGNRK